MKKLTKEPTPSARSWLFRLIVFSIPLAAFVCLELILRVSNYGEDLSLFTARSACGGEYMSMNPGVRGRYFFRTDFQPGASPDIFALSKPTKTIRLFCLGESTTAGYPYWYNASFSAFLRTSLEKTFPDHRIEVVNLGMTATNSFAVLDQAREVLRYQPDAIVVYDGHNEFYGALGVASRESIGRSRWMVQLYLYLLRFRTFLLLRDGLGSLISAVQHSEPGVDRATLMEKLGRGRMVPFGTALYAQGIETFRENLRDLSTECARAHVPLILCTQVSNLSMPPFASVHSASLAADRCRTVEAWTDSGGALLHRGRFEESATILREALAVDSNYAMSHYLLALANDSLRRVSDAEREYREARDKDPVRFRACTDLNQVILSCGNGTHIADVESTFASAGGGHIGFNLITEHLHPTVYGQFLIARTILATMMRDGILFSNREWSRRDTIPDSLLWDQRTVTPLDERIGERKTEVLTAGWPFSQVERILNEIPATDTLGLIAESVTRGRLDWREAHESAGAYYAHRGEYSRAAAEMRAIALTFRLDSEAYKRWARFAMRAGQSADARSALETESVFCPDAEGEKMLGDLFLAGGDYRGAEARYRSALALDSPVKLQEEIRYARSLALLKMGMLNESREELAQVLRLDPANRNARDLLNRLPAGRNTPP